MAIQLKTTAAPTATPAKAAPTQQKTTLGSPKAPGTSSHAQAVPKSGSLLKRGSEAQQAFAQEEHKAELRSKDSVFRFWIPKDKDSSITFLDGDLSDGVLDIPFMFEHNINMNGKYGNFFACTQDQEPCPICEGGSSASYVGLLTVIDHSEYISKKDNALKKDNVKLFVAKRDTIKQLQKLAVKRGGLRGCRFDVSRTGDKSPSVGNVFDFTEKYSEATLLSNFGADRIKPINYEDMIQKMYMPASELRKLGFGSSAGPAIGAEAPMTDNSYDGEL